MSLLLFNLTSKCTNEKFSKIISISEFDIARKILNDKLLIEIQIVLTNIYKIINASSLILGKKALFAQKYQTGDLWRKIINFSLCLYSDFFLKKLILIDFCA